MNPQHALGTAYWLSRDDFPFVSRAFESSDGNLHYVDEGRGHTLLFVHGCPTWSFFYRKLIRELARDFRCVAVDHLGFGLSEKPEQADYSFSAHVRRLGEFAHHLDLQGVTLIGHDLGTAIGLAAALDDPALMRDFVSFNAWMWPVHEEPWVRRLHQVACNRINLFWQATLNTSPKFFLPVMFADLHSLRRSVQNQYLEPFRSVPQRNGAFTMVRSLTSASGDLEALWSSRRRLAERRALFLWGADDRSVDARYLDRWMEALPLGQAVVIEGCGNYVPEHAAPRCAAEIRAFLSGASSADVTGAVKA